jgi:hypothetical protein
MENVLQELDGVVKDESAPLPFVISPQKVESALKRFKKTLLLPDASEEENKQGVETPEEDSQISPKKNRGQPLGSKNNKKNLAASNVVQKRNVPSLCLLHYSS